MSSLVSACAAGPVIEFGGSFLRIYPRSMQVTARLEAQIWWLRGDPMNLARELVFAAPDVAKRDVGLACLKTIRHKWYHVSDDEVNRYVASPEGRVMLLYLILEPNGVTYDWVRDRAIEKFNAEGQDWFLKILWAVKIASGTAELLELSNLRNINEATESEVSQYESSDAIISAFAKEPFNVSPFDVERMTMYQIQSIINGINNRNSDQQSEYSEAINPVQLPGSSASRKFIEQARQLWNQRYDRILANLINGHHILHGLRND